MVAAGTGRMTTINQAVGIRNGTAPMPNTSADLAAITGLLDRIPLANGGTASTPGLWSPARTLLIPQVAAAIVAFQTWNRRPTIDGVVDPGGGTLRLMDQLASPAPVTAEIVTNETNAQAWVVADQTTLDGHGPIGRMTINPSIRRFLIRTTGCSIKWFGVVLPLDQLGRIMPGRPHLFFTPAPWQGGHQDPMYDSFRHWTGLWDKYTSAIGSQLVVSGAPQILVVPFYKNSQLNDLGGFLQNWKQAVTAVVTAAINAVDPLYLRNDFEFSEIHTSSFSNGIVPHRQFNTRGIDVNTMTRMAYDLDGQASGTVWHTSRMVTYANTPVPRTNPVGMRWHVGGRLGELGRAYPGAITHNLCPFLLIHGLTRHGR